MSENEYAERDLEELAEMERMEEEDSYPVSVVKKPKKGFTPLIVAAAGIVIGGIALLKRRKKNRVEAADNEEDEIDEFEDETLEDAQTEEEVVEELHEDLKNN